MPLDPSLKATRRHLKIEKMVRLEVGGFSDEEIGMHCGCSKQYVSMLRKTPEYIRIRIEVASNLISDYDRPLEDIGKTTSEEIKQMVPASIAVLKQRLFDGTNPKLQMEAAKEFLDREGTHVKVSKSEIKQKQEFNFNMHEAIKDDLLAALSATVPLQEIEDTQTLFSASVSTEEQVELTQKMPLKDMIPASDSIQ